MSIQSLARRFEPRVLAALLAAFADIRNKARVVDIERLLKNGDVEGALRVVGVDAAAFTAFENTLVQAYGASGAELADKLPRLKDPRTATRAVFRFDTRNARAEAYLREHSARLIGDLVDEQRLVIRTALQDGLARGVNPRQTALDIVGRVDVVTGRRVGGVIGLNRPQAGYVANMRAELADPTRMSNYFTREMRDKRFDKIVAKALKDKVPLSRANIDKLTGRYADRLIKLRGDTVTRTETLNALREAKVESAKQLVDTGRVQKSQTQKVWDSSGDDGRTRDSHLAMEGVAVGIDEPFTLPDGSQVMYPGDASLGAPLSEIIACRCVVKIKIDFLKGAL